MYILVTITKIEGGTKNSTYENEKKKGQGIYIFGIPFITQALSPIPFALLIRCSFM